MSIQAKIKIISVLVITASFWFANQAKGDYADDFRIWNEFMYREYKDAKWQTYTWAELRWLDNASDLDVWVAQQKLYYKAKPWLQLGGGVGWIEINGSDDSWNTLARLELEANPSWILGEGRKLTLRNRLETRWWESRDYKAEFVSRHRFLYAQSAKWLPSMTRFEVSNEIFFDYDKGRINENRFRPLNVFFQIKEGASINFFGQVRSRRLGSDRSWKHAYILGTGFRF